MKILVLGSIGMAGHTITLYFKERGYDVTAFSISSFPYVENNIIGDAFDQKLFEKIITDGKYDVIINCIGLLNQIAEQNQAKAVYLNSYLPHLICDTLRDKKTKLIHMSTDCVFKGNTGPYFENSLRDGLTFYDRSKALGEVEDNKNLTFRNSIIGPDMNEKGIGLFNWFMKQNDTISGYTGAIWTGVTTLTLAKAMEQAIKEDLTGLYNLVNNESISKYGLMLLFNKYFKNNSLEIKKDNKFQLDKSLRNSRTDFGFIVPSYEEMIIEMKDWIENHSELYPHYKNIQ
ncbi:MAG: sugar nucleotide-binding protein [Bacteroidales bacterium]|jgi:dTDP-4-dehydrorhamnose reductase|nr:sugar nucleotide-binding protein [Bacteroidales bacterium]